ncbi:MAG TPA: branched-chain amino acid ABC transporter permease [Xanthobacteraceae bacterium]|jgi:branched-chain amino acid transport system permease protein
MAVPPVPLERLSKASAASNAWALRLLMTGAVAVLIVLSLAAPIGYVFLTTEVLIAIVYATSLNLLMGYGGMLSLGHAAYYALGAYTTALLTVKVGWPMAAAMLAGPVVAALFAAIFGLLIVRTSHLEHAYFLMLTLAFSQLVFVVIYKWYDLTHGDDGITGIFPAGLIGTPRSYCIFVVLVSSACLWLLYRLVHSPFGLILQAIRDNPTRVEFVGLSVRRHQLAAFVIAGCVAGISGTLYAYFAGTISPQLADWAQSARPFIANTIGGIQSFWGPAIGVIVLELVDSQFARFTEHSLLAVGLLAVFVGIFFPQGMIGLFGGRSADRAHGLWKRLRSGS